MQGGKIHARASFIPVAAHRLAFRIHTHLLSQLKHWKCLLMLCRSIAKKKKCCDEKSVVLVGPLVGDGSVVGGVGSDHSVRVHQLVTSHVGLTHFSQAEWRQREIDDIPGDRASNHSWSIKNNHRYKFRLDESPPLERTSPAGWGSTLSLLSSASPPWRPAPSPQTDLHTAHS